MRLLYRMAYVALLAHMARKLAIRIRAGQRRYPVANTKLRAGHDIYFTLGKIAWHSDGKVARECCSELYNLFFKYRGILHNTCPLIRTVGVFHGYMSGLGSISDSIEKIFGDTLDRTTKQWLASEIHGILRKFGCIFLEPLERF